MVSRRRLLQAGATGVTMLAAGCNSISEPKPTEIGNVQTINNLPEAVDVQLLISENGSPVYWKSHTLPAATGDERTTREFTGLPDEPGQYTVYSRTRAFPENEWETISPGSVDCRAFILEIGEGEDEGPETIDVWSTANANWCNGRWE